MAEWIKVALITGSTKGIGFGIAESLIQQGVRVVITSRKLEQAQETALLLQKKYKVDTLGLAYDIEQQQGITDLVANVIGHFGQLDILVNSALSQNCIGPLESFTDEQITTAIGGNIGNTLLLSKACFPFLKKTQGNIINVTSVIVNKHLVGLPLYGIIKGAVVQMTEVLAAEWAVDNIRVNAINPGFIKTQAFEELDSEDAVKSYEFYKGYCPLGKIGLPKDIGKLAAFLASDDAGFMTGSVIDADGGYSIQGLSLYRKT